MVLEPCYEFLLPPKIIKKKTCKICHKMKEIVWMVGKNFYMKVLSTDINK